MSAFWLKIITVGAVGLMWVLVVGLTVAILGALFAPLLSSILAAVMAVGATYARMGTSTGRHAYNAARGRSEGVKRAGIHLVYRDNCWEVAR